MDKTKILVVDDESRMRKLVHDFLAKQDYIVLEAENGEEAVDLFFEQKDNVLTMHIAKSRDSDAGKKISYAIDLDKGVFNYIPAEDNALEGAGCKELAEEYGDVEDDYF